MVGYALDNIRVLVVDENDYSRQLLRTILHSVGARTVDLAGSVEAGFEAYCRHVYDIVFVDSDMAPLSGFDMLKLMRTSPQSPNPYVPVIMVSSCTNEDQVKRARDGGVSEFLAKPFTVDIVIRRLEAVIENPRSFVRTMTYFGPDRRRKPNSGYAGPERRKVDPVAKNLSEHDINMRQRAALTHNVRAVDNMLHHAAASR